MRTLGIRRIRQDSRLAEISTQQSFWLVLGQIFLLLYKMQRYSILSLAKDGFNLVYIFESFSFLASISAADSLRFALSKSAICPDCSSRGADPRGIMEMELSSTEVEFVRRSTQPDSTLLD